jgi:hypothetical protein
MMKTQGCYLKRLGARVELGAVQQDGTLFVRWQRQTLDRKLAFDYARHRAS